MYFRNDFVQHKSIAYEQKAERTLIKKFKSKANVQEIVVKPNFKQIIISMKAHANLIAIQIAKQGIPCSPAPKNKINN